MKTLPNELPFRSFFMGGFECSTHRLKSGRRLDLIAATRHDEFATKDYQRMLAVGMKTARDGLRWHRIETSPGRYDFSCDLPMIRAARETGMQVIWDLLHYGWPDDLDIFSSEFVPRFRGFARAAAELIASEIEDRPLLFCPVNEISFFAWAGGGEAIFNPCVRGRGDELKIQLVRCALAAVDAIREVAPDSRIVHTDPVINVVCSPDRPEQAEAAEHHRLSSFDALDMIAGTKLPELGGAPHYLDILGLNYYVHNQWTYPGGFGSMIEPSDPKYQPVWKLLGNMWERYRRPMFIAETGIEDHARPAWLRYISHEVREATRRGIPVGGVCLYPIVNHPGWEDDRHCYNGLWDYVTGDGDRQIYAPLAEELIAESRTPEIADERAVDRRELDIAAHWMEITSTRGFQKERAPRPDE